MSPWERALEDFLAVVREEEEAERDGVWTHSIGKRRIAATRRLHELEDPWSDCRCEACSYRD